MTIPRRTFTLGGGALLMTACAPARSKPVTHRPLAELPTTTLPWLSLRDHFVATVGPHAGQGRPLGSLLVLADATFAPRSRFPLHPHREMEILSIVVEGTLSHHGDQADGATIGQRSAQLISSRDGMVHAEGNDTDEPVRMLQIWFDPSTHGGAPAYFARQLPVPGRHLMAGDAAMPLRADAQVWWIDLTPGRTEGLRVDDTRRAYLLAMTSPIVVSTGRAGSPTRLATGEGLVVPGGAVELLSEAPGAVLWIDVA